VLSKGSISKINAMGKRRKGETKGTPVWEGLLESREKNQPVTPATQKVPKKNKLGKKSGKKIRGTLVGGGGFLETKTEN